MALGERGSRPDELGRGRESSCRFHEHGSCRSQAGKVLEQSGRSCVCERCPITKEVVVEFFLLALSPDPPFPPLGVRCASSPFCLLFLPPVRCQLWKTIQLSLSDIVADGSDRISHSTCCPPIGSWSVCFLPWDFHRIFDYLKQYRIVGETPHSSQG